MFGFGRCLIGRGSWGNKSNRRYWEFTVFLLYSSGHADRTWYDFKGVRLYVFSHVTIALGLSLDLGFCKAVL